MAKIDLFPQPENPPESLEALLQKTRSLAKQSTNVYLNTQHVKDRMKERHVSIRQVLDVLQNGRGIDGPTLDQYGDWRIKLKRYSCGRVVQVVVVVKNEYLEVITVI